jgi:hypothetical protein
MRGASAASSRGRKFVIVVESPPKQTIGVDSPIYASVENHSSRLKLATKGACRSTNAAWRPWLPTLEPAAAGGDSDLIHASQAARAVRPIVPAGGPLGKTPHKARELL